MLKSQKPLLHIASPSAIDHLTRDADDRPYLFLQQISPAAGRAHAQHANHLVVDARHEVRTGDEERNAHFISVIAVGGPDGLIGTAEGRVDGVILRESRGEGGFGYDPVFYHEASGGTFAEIPLDVKNRVSHRGRALEGAKKILARLSGGTLE